MAFRGGSKDRVVLRHLAPSKNLQAKRFGDLLKGLLALFHGCGLRFEEDIADGVLAWRWEGDIKSLGLLMEEIVRNAGHDACTVAIPRVRTDGTSVGHVTQDAA